MVLTQFELENFKSFLTRQKLPLAPITLLYGPNGGGKSSVIQALLALRQTFDDGMGEFITDGWDVKLGGLRAAMSRHELDRQLVFALSQQVYVGKDQWVDSTTELHYGRDNADSEVGALNEMKLSWCGPVPGCCRVKASPCHHVPRMTDQAQFPTIIQNMVREKKSHTFAFSGARLYQIADASFPIIALTEEWKQESVFGAMKALMDTEGARVFPMHFIALDGIGLPGIIGDAINGSWDPEKGVIPNALADDKDLPLPLKLLATNWSTLVDEDSRPLADLVHIEPLRQHPERLYFRSGHARPSHTSSYPTVESWADLLRECHQDGNDFSFIINAYLKQFGIHYQMRVKEVDLEGAVGYYQILLDDPSTSTTVTLADAGFGMSQLLPILTHGFLPFKRAKMIAVQQPELHLHPRLQGHLADFFIDTSVRADSPEKMITHRSQWLVETHSEALVTRIQRRVREGRIKPTDVSILYVDRLDGQGSVVTPMRLDEHGDFMDEWPGGFFEDGFDDLFGLDK